MEIIFFLIPVCIIIAGSFVFGFYWMTKSGQYDDLETPAHRILLEDKIVINNINTSIKDFNKE